MEFHEHFDILEHICTDITGSFGQQRIESVFACVFQRKGFGWHVPIKFKRLLIIPYQYFLRMQL